MMVNGTNTRLGAKDYYLLNNLKLGKSLQSGKSYLVPESFVESFQCCFSQVKSLSETFTASSNLSNNSRFFKTMDFEFMTHVCVPLSLSLSPSLAPEHVGAD